MILFFKIKNFLNKHVHADIIVKDLFFIINLIKDLKWYSLFSFIFTPVMSFLFCIYTIMVIIHVIVYAIVFTKRYLLKYVFYRNQESLIYTFPDFNLNNFYLIYICIYYYNMPKQYAYNYFYKLVQITIKMSINFKNDRIKFNKTNCVFIFLKFFFTYICIILLRLLFLFVTSYSIILWKLTLVFIKTALSCINLKKCNKSIT